MYTLYYYAKYNVQTVMKDLLNTEMLTWRRHVKKRYVTNKQHKIIKPNGPEKQCNGPYLSINKGDHFK